MKPTNTILLTALILLSASTSSATILAYEGFATDASGTGNNYQDGVTLGSYIGGTGQDFNGIDKTRLGFTGGWGQVNAQMTDSVNSRAITGGLSYPNFQTGDAGTGNPFRTGGTPSTTKYIGRDLTVDNTGGQLNGGYYIAVLVDFNSTTDGGGFGWRIGGNSDNTVEFNGDAADTATFRPGGTNPNLATFNTSDGTNLIVIQYTNDNTGTAGNQNSAFYTRYNLWVNPDLSGGDLGTITATGFGIGLNNNGVVQDFNYMFLSSSDIEVGEELFVDEFYIATDPSDFISVPEPSTYALFLGVATLGLLICWRRDELS